MNTDGVVGSTLILMADFTEKQIKDIIIGDQIISVDRETAELTTETVTSITSNMSTELMMINDRNKLIVSPTKLTQIDRTGHSDTLIVKTGELYTHCLIYIYDKNERKINYTSVFKIINVGIENEMIYNITTAGNNTYIASNFIICN